MFGIKVGDRVVARGKIHGVVLAINSLVWIAPDDTPDKMFGDEEYLVEPE